MHEYLKQYPRHDSELFEQFVYTTITEENKYYGLYHTAFPYFDSEFPWKNELSNLPVGLAASAADGRPNVSGLDYEGIVHEWMVKPGWRLFLNFKLQSKYKEKFKHAICGKGGPYEQLKNGLLNPAALLFTVTQEVLKKGFSDDTLWIPLGCYMAFLLVKKGLKNYCE